MRLVATPPPVFTTDNPYDSDIDVLGREKFGNSLKNLIFNSSDEGLVIALNAPWGEGKTFFVKMWQASLNKGSPCCLYFDAFKNDYLDDAFITLSSEIIEFARFVVKDKDDGTYKAKINDIIVKAGNAGRHLLPWATKIGIKVATLNMLDINEFMAVRNEIAKDSSKYLSDQIGKQVIQHKAEMDTLQTFTTSLGELATSIRAKTKKPLVIIIDELDRCKPTFAVAIIERIKHLFSVQDIVFLLVMNKPELEKSFKSVYGDIDTHTYMQKFITLECLLPNNTNPNHKYLNKYRRYSAKLIKTHDLLKYMTPLTENKICDVIEFFGEHFELTLREIEKCFVYLTICYSSISKGTFKPFELIFLLAVLKTKKPEYYRQLNTQTIETKNILKLLDFDKYEVTRIKTNDSTSRNLSSVRYVTSLIKLCLLPDSEFNALPDSDDAKQLANSRRIYSSRNSIIPNLIGYMEIAHIPD